MKGQLVFEFIVAAVLFIGIVIFVLNTLNSNVAQFTGSYFSQSLEHKALIASEALVKTRSGIVGLAESWPVLNSSKIQALQAFCNDPLNYTDFLMKLNLEEKPGFGTYDARLIINNTKTGATLLDCKPPLSPFLPSSVSSTHLKRFAILNNSDPVEVIIWIW